MVQDVDEDMEEEDKKNKRNSRPSPFAFCCVQPKALEFREKIDFSLLEESEVVLKRTFWFDDYGN